MREERRWFMETAAESGRAERGRGDRERDVDRELAPERDGRVGMWMVRERRREARLCPPQLPVLEAVLSRLRGLTTSGGGVALLAGLLLPADSGRWDCERFSRGSGGWRRRDDGLCEAGLLDDIEAAACAIEEEGGRGSEIG